MMYLIFENQWSDRKKNFQLFIVILASIIPDFDNGIGMDFSQ